MLRCPCCTKDHPIPIQGAHHVYLKCLKAHRRAFCIACESVVTETDLPAHQVTCLDEWIDALLESGPLTGAVTVQYPPSIGRKMMHYCPCSACLEKVLGQTPQHKKTRLRTAGKGLPIYKYLPDSESHIASHVREAAKSTKPACPIYGCGDDVRDEVQLLSHLAVEHSISALVDDQLSRIRPQNIKAALKGISSLKVFSATGRNAKVCIKPHGGVYDEWRKKRKTATQTNTDAREGDE